MGTDRSDPIGGPRPPPILEKPKTISGPYQSYQILVSVSTLTELKSMQPPGVNGAPTFFRDNGLPWYWFSQLPPGFVPSSDGSNGVVSSNKSGFFISLFKLVAAVTLGAFLTCARASTSRMLDVPSSTLFLVADGARTYVRSFVSGWHWKANFPAATATDNKNTCRPLAWAALGLDGAFVRDVQGDQTTRTQGAWFVDANAPDDEGTGAATDPVQTDAEIVRRWGEGVIPLTVPVVVTYVNSQTGTNQTNFRYSLQGGSLSLFGVVQQSAPAAFTAVTVMNRATQTFVDVTGPGLGAGNIGQIIQIVQSVNPASVGAYATVAFALGPNQVRVTPFVTFSPTVAFFSTVISAVAGDVFVVITPPTINVGSIVQYPGAFNPTNPPAPTNCTQIDGLRLQGQTNLPAVIETHGNNIFYGRVVFQRIRFSGNNNTVHNFAGGSFVVGVSGITTGGAIFDATGFVNGCFFNVTAGSTALLRKDCLVDASTFTMSSASQIVSSGVAFFDCTNNNACNIIPGAVWRQTGGVADWGTTNTGHGLVVQSLGMYAYAVKPNVNGGLGAGRESQIGGVDTNYAAYPATGAVNATNFAAAVLTA